MALKKRVSKAGQYYDKIADHYEEDYSRDPYWRLYHDITWADIKRHLPKDKKSLIIDVGGGTGFWARKIAKLGYAVVVTDISEKMLKIGKAKAKRAGLSKRMFFTYADIVDMKDQRSGRYDLVICQGDPLSYCSDQGKAAKELVRIAKPGAKMIASVDNFFTAVHRGLAYPGMLKKLPALEKTHVSDFFDIHPQYNFLPEELKSLFQNNGCEVISLIGKPVFAHRSLLKENPDLLRKSYNKVLALEKKYNSHPSLVGSGGHIQIVVMKARKKL